MLRGIRKTQTLCKIEKRKMRQRESERATRMEKVRRKAKHSPLNVSEIE